MHSSALCQIFSQSRTTVAPKYLKQNVIALDNIHPSGIYFE